MANHSPFSMPINKTVEEVLVAIGFAFTEAGHLGEDLWNLPCYLICLLGLSLEKVWIEGLGQSGFGID